MLNKTMQKLGEERSVIREIFEYGNRRAAEIGRENVYDFSLGNPSVPSPACVREEIDRLLNTMPPEVLHGYTSAAGAPDVRAAVASYIHESFGVPMDANLVYMTCGAAASLTITLNALAEEGDEFIVLTPYFPEYRVFIERAGAVCREVATDARFHIDIAAIEAAINEHTKGILVNSPNNPTGVVYDEEEFLALGKLLKEKSVSRPIFLIADEPYRELTYGKSVPYPMNYYENTILCYSFSKSLSLAGERIGYIAVSPMATNANDIFSAVAGAGRSLGYVCAPAMFQYVAAACVDEKPDIEAYRRNRDLIYSALTEMGYDCVRPDGAFYLFVRSLEADANAFSDRAKNYGLLIVPGDSFGAPGYVRISYCVSHDMIERSLPAFRALIDSYKK